MEILRFSDTIVLFYNVLLIICMQLMLGNDKKINKLKKCTSYIIYQSTRDSNTVGTNF